MVMEPKIGGRTPTRQCGVQIGDGVCGNDAVIHVLWPSGKYAFTCAQHEGPTRRFDTDQIHNVGSDCGMPGAKWNREKNICVVDDDDLDLTGVVYQARPAEALQQAGASN